MSFLRACHLGKASKLHLPLFSQEDGPNSLSCTAFKREGKKKWNYSVVYTKRTKILTYFWLQTEEKLVSEKKKKKRHDFADNKPMECMKCQSHGLILNLKIFFQFSKLIINKIKFVLQSKLIYNIYLGQIFDISRVFYLFIFIY